MIVVIIVSRRVGQVTLLVSERTSCRNLNGLIAIVGVRVRRETTKRVKNSPPAPIPLVLKGEPPSGLDDQGVFEAAPDIRQNGPTAGGGYVLRTDRKVKVRGNAVKPARVTEARTVGFCDQWVK